MRVNESYNVQEVQKTLSTKESGRVSREFLNNQKLKDFKQALDKNSSKNIEIEESLSDAVEVINDGIKIIDSRLEFQVHDTTNRTTVRVINRETEEVIREIPPEEILDLVGRMMEMVGLIIDERA